MKAQNLLRLSRKRLDEMRPGLTMERLKEMAQTADNAVSGLEVTLKIRKEASKGRSAE